MQVQKIINDEKNKEILNSVIKIILAVGVFINFWIFGRFTVDDAFITWRYGKNLVFHGIWNYNPSSYDMTQAYTNPIYAFLSIIPAYFKIDTVFFFKIFSLLLVISFVIYYIRKVKQGVIILLVTFILPQTMIHIFSGLETFLFIALTTMLIISIYEESWYSTIITSSLLFYTRYESLTLIFIVPFVYCNWQSIEYIDIFKIRNYSCRNLLKFIRNFITVKSIKLFFILLLVLLPNLVISYLNFDNILPNTFFVKNSSIFSFRKLLWYGLALLPIIMAYKYIPPRKSIPIILFFLFMCLQYSKTDFLMDYSIRSIYHIFFPIVLFVFYLIEKENINSLIKISDVETNSSISFKYKNLCKVVIFFILVFFFSRESIGGLAFFSNYYYCCLSAHAITGKVINNIKYRYNINSISCGDAGMLSFHADIDSLDLVGLGSAILTHDGIDVAYSLYRPNILFIHGNEKELYEGVYEYVSNISQYENIGKITWTRENFLWVYSNNNIPELVDIFKSSYNTNYRRIREIIVEHIYLPPWSQWHE